ncbi:putative serine/threonine-protein kinase MPS1 like protein [Dictyocoela roeselum]|nr:putative serine/threonine-protein kinase MPS1 like protein [Dictyocoela roeselum]
MKFNNYKFNKDRNECSKDSNEYSKDKYSNAYSKDKYSNEYSQDKYRNEYSKDEYSKSNVISNIPNKNNSINNHYTHKNNSIHPVNSKEIKKFSCKMITDDYSLKLTDQIKLLTKENKNLKNSNDNNNTACNTNLNLNKDLKYITLKDKKLLILRLIGTGGSSKVYQVLYNNRNYALKKVNMNHTTLYRNEIKMLEKLRGFDGIIEMVDYEVKEDEILILMEYGDCDLSSIIPKRGAVNNCFKNGRDDDGETDNKFVDSFISDNSKNNHQNTLSVAYIRSIWEQIILIMKRVYEEKIVHCDLKPQNFIFVKGRIKLIDFGISKMGLSDTTSVVNDNRGTVNYIAPEMVKNEKIRRSVDIWSLGCILYEMVYNRSIFEGNMLQKITFLQNNRVIVYEDKVGYENLIDVIKMCLRYDPEERVSINELVLENYVYQQEVGRKCRNNSNDQIMSRDKDVFKDKMSIMIPKIVDFVKNNKNLSNEDLVNSITRNLNLFL